MSSPVILADSDDLSTQFRLHQLCDAFPDGLYAEVAGPLVWPLYIYTLPQPLHTDVSGNAL